MNLRYEQPLDGWNKRAQAPFQVCSTNLRGSLRLQRRYVREHLPLFTDKTSCSEQVESVADSGILEGLAYFYKYTIGC